MELEVFLACLLREMERYDSDSDKIKCFYRAYELVCEQNQIEFRGEYGEL